MAHRNHQQSASHFLPFLIDGGNRRGRMQLEGSNVGISYLQARRVNSTHVVQSNMFRSWPNSALQAETPALLTATRGEDSTHDLPLSVPREIRDAAVPALILPPGQVVVDRRSVFVKLGLFQ